MIWRHRPLTRYVKSRVAHAPGMPGIFFRNRLQRKPLVSDPGMHNGTCVTHVPWCMSRSFTRNCGENVPGIPGACAPAFIRIWQEAHTTDAKPLTIPYRWHYRYGQVNGAINDASDMYYFAVTFYFLGRFEWHAQRLQKIAIHCIRFRGQKLSHHCIRRFIQVTHNTSKRWRCTFLLYDSLENNF